MSSTAKIVWGIVVLAVIIAGWYYWSSSAAPATDTTGGNAAMNTTPSNTGGNSDADLAKDSAAIDAQLSGLDSDNAAAAQSDQQVSQTY